MYAITGLQDHENEELLRLLSAHEAAAAVPSILGLQRSLEITVIYLRRNRTQADLGQTYGVSQPTVSRAISKLTPAIAEALSDFIPTAEDVPTGTSYVVDGTLVPCWSWKSAPGLYSGKHHTTGCNLQVLATLSGRIAWVSDPTPGSTHDVTALDLSDILSGHDPSQWIADKGYIGRGMITPRKKPINQELPEADKKYNTSVHKIRWIIERAIAQLKTWRILHTDYRRPLDTFETTITAVLGLYFLTA